MLPRCLNPPSWSTCRFFFCFLLLLQTPRSSSPLITGEIKGIIWLLNNTAQHPPCVKSTKTPGYSVCLRVSMILQSVFTPPGSAPTSKSLQRLYFHEPVWWWSLMYGDKKAKINCMYAEEVLKCFTKVLVRYLLQLPSCRLCRQILLHFNLALKIFKMHKMCVCVFCVGLVNRFPV